MRGARFLHIGDGDQAGLVAGLSLLELALNGLQCRLLRFEIILRGQHIEVALRHALDQVLAGGLIVRFGLGDLGIGTLQSHPVLPPKQVLFQIETVAARGGLGLPGKGEGLEHRGAGAGGRRNGRDGDGLDDVRGAVVMLAADDAAGRELRQEIGERLRLGLERRQTGRLGFPQLGIVLQGSLVHRQEIGGRGGPRRRGGRAQSQ